MARVERVIEECIERQRIFRIYHGLISASQQLRLQQLPYRRE